MASETWYEVGSKVGSNRQRCGNMEEARSKALEIARDVDYAIEIHQVTRALVSTVQRSVSVAETPVL